jgi:hypothetical protein
LAVGNESATAAEAHVDLLRATDWLCDDASCPLVTNNVLVYRDLGHVAATISAALAPRPLWELDRLPSCGR